MPPHSIVVFVPAGTFRADARLLAALALMYAVSGGATHASLGSRAVRPIVIGEDVHLRKLRSRPIRSIPEPNPDLRRTPPRRLGRENYPRTYVRRWR
jgi:hypothetical protein